MSLGDMLKTGGRKYAVVIRVVELGFILSLLGLLVIALVPEIAAHVGTVLGSFGLLGSASIVAYNGANAAADWHTTPKASPTATPAPRQSGTVPAVGGE
jgi:hypothetical protein